MEFRRTRFRLYDSNEKEPFVPAFDNWLKSAKILRYNHEFYLTFFFYKTGIRARHGRYGPHRSLQTVVFVMNERIEQRLSEFLLEWS